VPFIFVIIAVFAFFVMGCRDSFGVRELLVFSSTP